LALKSEHKIPKKLYYVQNDYTILLYNVPAVPVVNNVENEGGAANCCYSAGKKDDGEQGMVAW
jgi:hypothetical protein